jgi:hypothetical protein
MMNGQRPSRLIVTWSVLIPALLVIALVLSPGTIFGMFIAAAISPVVHAIVRLFYPGNEVEGGGHSPGAFTRR